MLQTYGRRQASTYCHPGFLVVPESWLVDSISAKSMVYVDVPPDQVC